MFGEVSFQECLTSLRYMIDGVLWGTLHLPIMAWLLQGRAKEHLAWPGPQ